MCVLLEAAAKPGSTLTSLDMSYCDLSSAPPAMLARAGAQLVRAALPGTRLTAAQLSALLARPPALALDLSGLPALASLPAPALASLASLQQLRVANTGLKPDQISVLLAPASQLVQLAGPRGGP